MLIRSVLIVLSALLFSGCGVLDFFTIAERETSSGEGNAGDAPPNLVYLEPSEGDEMLFDLGTFCWTNASIGMCVDKIPPEYTAEQHLAVGREMNLQFAEPLPESISVSLYPGSNLFAQESIPLEASLASDGSIALSLPENLQGNYILAVFAAWQGGDAFYTLPIAIEG